MYEKSNDSIILKNNYIVLIATINKCIKNIYIPKNTIPLVKPKLQLKRGTQ